LWTRGHSNQVYTSEGRGASVNECDELVKSGLFEVSVENGGTQDGGQIEKHELCGDNDLMDVQWVLDDSSSADYLAIKPHQGTIQVSYLADSSAKEDLEEMMLWGAK